MFGTCPQYLRLLRVRSWIGWIFYYALGFLLFAMPSPGMVAVGGALASATAGIFVLNQCCDTAGDRLHFTKNRLPVAAGTVPLSGALSLYAASVALSLGLVAVSDPSLIPLFLVYIGGGVCYSVPPVRVKGRPLLDVAFVGAFSGVMPFLIGAQASHRLSLAPWGVGSQDALLVAGALFLFQSSAHLFQAAGDYEADMAAGARTSVVRFGRGRSVVAAKALAAASLVMPLAYGAVRFPLGGYALWCLLASLSFAPVALYLVTRGAPSRERVGDLTAVAKGASPLVYAALFVAVLLIRASL